MDDLFSLSKEKHCPFISGISTFWTERQDGKSQIPIRIMMRIRHQSFFGDHSENLILPLVIVNLYN